MQTISVIIPILNEEQLIGSLVQYLFKHSNHLLKEVIVVDGNSNDDSVAVAKNAGAKVIKCVKCGRAHQMNKGVQASTGQILFFVHCDTLPPTSYLEDIFLTVKKGYKIGCFRVKYQSKNWLLRINSYCTRFPSLWCRGGDQTLFVTRSFFDRLGAFRADCKIMEEYELIEKAQEITTFFIHSKEVLVSSRKYDNRSYMRIQIANLVAFWMYSRKRSDMQIADTYRKLLG